MADKLVYNLQDILKDKNTNLKPENLRAGVTCLGVEGTLEESIGEGVKQFASVEEMNNSTGNNEGDLAVVYTEEIVDMVADGVYQSFVFSEKEVVLPEKLTSGYGMNYGPLNPDATCKQATIILQPTDFRFIISGSGGQTIKYTSTDYQTFTRTEDTYGETLELDSKVQLHSSDQKYWINNPTWSDCIKYFIKAKEKIFNGLYEYKNSEWVLIPSQLTLTQEDRLLIGETAYGETGIITGTMPNNGELTYTPSEEEQEIPAGYTSGGTIKAISYTDLGTITPEEYTQAETQINDLFGEEVDE